MRGIYEQVRQAGAEVVAIGTGNSRYARRFIEDEDIPFPVLVDDDAEAAKLASVRKASPMTLVGPRALAAGARVFAEGHRQHRTGKRGTQLGATFVVGPGSVVHFEHLDATADDHAPLDAVLGALSSR